MTRIVLAILAAAAIAAPALADEIHHGPARMHKPVSANHMGAHHHPTHCTIRHHHRVCG
jgi:hypothetical protein